MDFDSSQTACVAAAIGHVTQGWEMVDGGFTCLSLHYWTRIGSDLFYFISLS